MNNKIKRFQQLAGINENFDKIDGVIKTEAIDPISAENGNTEANDKIAALGITENEVNDISLKHSSLILPALRQAGLTNYMDEMDDFDIAEAVAVYTYDYNENIDTIHKLNQLLRNVNFNPSHMFSYDKSDLDDFSQMIYDALVDYYQNNDNKEIDENTKSTTGEPAPKDETPIQHKPTSTYNEIRNLVREILLKKNDLNYDE